MRQQRGLPAAGRTIPDLLIHMNGQVFLCDVTVADTLADSNLATAATGPARLAKEAARGKSTSTSWQRTPCELCTCRSLSRRWEG